MFAIHPEPMYYDWGSSSLVTEVFSRPVPDGLRLAELWMGTHPRGPSRLADPTTGKALLTAADLGNIVQRHRDACLGKNGGEQAEGLPYLLKILSAGKALSIQVHPDRDQARAGFDRENAKGLPIGAGSRNYKDPNHKPECILALSEFYALQGFRPPAEIRDSLEPAARFLSRAFAELSKPEVEAALGGFLAKSLSLDPEDLEAALEALRLEAQAAVDADPNLSDTSPHRWFLRMRESFPGDPGLLAAYYLNIVKILPGQALMLEARVLHAYLEGIGVELMANSDNVLRAGCTSKHIDIDELLRITLTVPGAGTKYEPELGTWLDGGFEEFRLYLGPKEAQVSVPAQGSPRIVLAIGSTLTLRYTAAPEPTKLPLAAEPGFAREVHLKPGQAAFLPAGVPETVLEVKERTNPHLPAWVMAAPGGK